MSIDALPLGAFRGDLRTCAKSCSSCHAAIGRLCEGVEARDKRISELVSLLRKARRFVVEAEDWPSLLARIDSALTEGER
jgi:hypothetical protein